MGRHHDERFAPADRAAGRRRSKDRCGRRPGQFAGLFFGLFFGLTSGLVASLILTTPCAAQDEPRLDDLRLKGTHNSYHLRPVLAIHPRHRYEHASLSAQLEHQGVRALELDVHLSDEGEFEVYHIAWVDGRSHCRKLRTCLDEIASWSARNPDHVPLTVWIETKDYAGGRDIASVRPVDAVIRDALGERLLAPDDVRRHHVSLREALAIEGWPSVWESRGRVMFMLQADADQLADYTAGLRHLEGRAMFAAGGPEHYEAPWAGVAKLNRFRPEDIERAKRSRLLLTTAVCLAEMDDAECFRDRDRALAAGVHILLDDFVQPTPGRDYWLELDFSRIAALESGIAESAPLRTAREAPGS